MEGVKDEKGLEIVILGHPALRKKAEEVKEIDGSIKELVDQMAYTMYKAKGLGLAANQVAVLKRVFIIDISQKENKPLLEVYINPEIVSAEGKIVREEGCLSIPGYYAKVERFSRIFIKAYDLKEKLIERELEGLHAIAFQHELDHLNGILFIDHLSPLKQALFKRWWKKHGKKKK